MRLGTAAVLAADVRLASRPMRAALVAPPWLESPPVGYGGIEALCAELAQGLVECGHEVTMVGAAGP
jgi:hypothetical protein